MKSSLEKLTIVPGISGHEKTIFNCTECNPEKNPNECYLSSVTDIVTGKLKFKCIGKK